MFLSPKLHYWTVMWTGHLGQWDTPAMLQTMAASTLQMLPPPVDSVFYLIGDSMLKEQGGRKHPLGHTTRHSEHNPYTFGFEMVLLIASWGALRIPIAMGLIDPQCRGPQNSLFRQMLATCVPRCRYGMQATSVSNKYSFNITEKEVLFG
jgi:hypothetical protein